MGATIAIEPKRAERPSLRPAHDSHLVDAHVAEPGAQVSGGEQRVRSVERLVQRVRVEAVSLRKGAARAGGAGGQSGTHISSKRDRWNGSVRACACVQWLVNRTCSTFCWILMSSCCSKMSRSRI